MRGKILSRLDTKRKKATAAVLCVALVAVIGAGSVFAANSMNSLQVKVENGVRSFSTDDGKTWSTTAPEDVTVKEEDGKLTVGRGTPPKEGEGKGLLTRVENGVASYSTDGGKTWSEEAPEGAEPSVTIDK